ncbi:MAG: MBL fold metallo-hydrolase [Myxococcota bacterium]
MSAALLVALQLTAPLELYAFHHATGKNVATRLFIVDPKLPKRMDIAFTVGVVSHGERLILIDAGFLRDAVPKSFEVTDYRSVRDLLVDFEMEAEAVTDVVLTHEHWDHWNGITEIPNARIWLTPEAHAAARGPVRAHLKRAKATDRLRLVRGKTEVAPGILAIPKGLHTRGFLYVTVEHEDEAWVFASDLGALRANFERLKPTGQTTNPRKTRQWLREIRDAYPLDHIIPSHDLSLFEEGSRAWRARGSHSSEAE